MTDIGGSMDTSYENLPLLPLTSGVLLPGMVFTLALESDEAIAAVEAAEAAGGALVIVPFIDGRYASVGVVAEVAERGELPGGLAAVAVRGVERARLGTAVPGTGQALWVEVEPVDEDGPDHGTAVELAREYRAVLENILVSRGAGRLAERLPEVAEPGRVADLAGYSPDLTLAQKVTVLETVDVVERLRTVLAWAREVLADLTLRERIKTDVEEGMEKTQREFLLRRQLEAIRKELGDAGDDDANPDDYRSRAAAADLPAHVRSAVEREIGKLERTPEQSPEHGWIRTWLDTVLELPWGVESEDRIDLDEAARILDEDHDGLRDVKDRILEHLAVRKLQVERGLAPVGGRGAGAILALVGPPGVGKTSLGESVARTLGRSFVRVALGGVRDEAEIRGHRRTYVGAQPGRLVRALREAGSMNPVVLLDEVDKIGADHRGDPSSALLEVLDPAQNHTFRDHYLEVELDLSKVLFLATANVIDTIPGPLLDRMEVIRLDGYTEDEKVAIARNHLVGRQVARAALSGDDVELTDAALRVVVADYTREAGVRSLERELGKLLRKVAGRVAARADDATGPLVVDGGDVATWLGRPRYFFESAGRTSVPGVATGLAVTGAGGDVLSVEVTVMDGPEGLTITGQLGDVMRESAEIALSFVRSHAPELDIDPDAFAGKRFHIHVPAGAIPKDGPSAGVTMTTALVSLLTDRPVSPAVGMTGEVTLQGRVLPIGGVRQKVLAAHRAGLTTVVLPERNGPDLDDVPEAVREQMTFRLASHVHEVLEAALVVPDASGGRRDTVATAEAA
ncbi:MAG TPA: endopeptidase La [Acidimicrobiales bacterium]